MVSAIETVSVPSGAATERYRTAERTLWSAHELEPVGRWIELSNPRKRMRVLEIGSGDPWWDAPSEVAGHVRQYLMGRSA
jgi:protein-L-isoaspartate O-methyltransferase